MKSLALLLMLGTLAWGVGAVTPSQESIVTAREGRAATPSQQSIDAAPKDGRSLDSKREPRVEVLPDAPETPKEGKSLKDEDEAARKFFFAYASTTTSFSVSQSTSTIPFTCYSAVNPVACMGRRRSLKLSNVAMFADSKGILDSSLADSENLYEVESDAKQARFFFTVWSTSTSVLTITTYFTNTSATVSVSAACSVAGIVYNGC